MFLFLVCLALASSHADGIVFETWFEELPDKWYSDGEWEFNHPGAYAYWSSSVPDYWDAHMTSHAEPPYYILYFVPDGTDSLVVTIDHDLSLQCSDWGMGRAQVYFYATGYYEVLIYEAEATAENFADTQPITYTLDQPGPGTYIGFTFYIEGEEWEQWERADHRSSVQWTITHLIAVAYGDSLGMEPATWGRLKTLF